MRRCFGSRCAWFWCEFFLVSTFFFLVSGAALAQTSAGSFESVTGQVQIQRAGGGTIGAANGVGVNVGDRVITGPNGHAVIILSDQSRLEVGAGSSLTLDQFTLTGGGAATTRVSLFGGVLRSVVNAASGGPPADYQVHTPNAVAAVRGTRFDTAYTENVIRPGYQGCENYTDVSVYQGMVNLASLTAPNTGEDIPAGYEATLPCNQPPTTPGPLSMTGAVSLDTASSSGGAQFTGASPSSGGAPVPACPVCVNMTTTPTTPPPSGH